MNKESTLLFSGISNNRYQQKFWQDVRKDCKPGGQFMIDLSVRYNPSRFVSRNGEWTLPWDQTIPDKFKMPAYDSTFRKSFSEITDDRALDVKTRIINYNEKFALMYSGGIDSTVVLVSLLKNLSKKELKNIVICANKHSVIENPSFWKKYVWGKFKILNSSVTKFDDLVDAGYRPITADEGDSIFGTVFGLEFYQHYDYYSSTLTPAAQSNLKNLKEQVHTAHFSQFKDIILKHFEIPPQRLTWSTGVDIITNEKFSELWYQKMVKNIETSSVPVHTIQDFFWWQIFNLKFVNCAMRCSIFLNDRIDVDKMLNVHVMNWFTDIDYQLWSMSNNNNGEKIIGIDPSKYKMAARNYIYEFDKNEWYFNFKLKIASLGSSVTYMQDLSNLPLSKRPNARFGLDEKYNILSIDDKVVQHFIKENISKFDINW